MNFSIGFAQKQKARGENRSNGFNHEFREVTLINSLRLFALTLTDASGVIISEKHFFGAHRDLGGDTEVIERASMHSDCFLGGLGEFFPDILVSAREAEKFSDKIAVPSAVCSSRPGVKNGPDSFAAPLAACLNP